MMLITVEATIDKDGRLVFDEAIDLKGKRVLITSLPAEGDGEGVPGERATLAHASAHLSEPVLATYWNRPEEDAAWAHLKDLKAAPSFW